MSASSILVIVIGYLSDGYDIEYISSKLGIEDEGDVITLIDELRKINYKESIKNKKGNTSISMSQIVNLYLNGFTYEEIGYLTKYTKEGIRNKINPEMIKEGRVLKECRSKNREMRKSMRDCLFYELYLRDLDSKNIDEVIRNSPYSESTFITKMNGLR